MMIAGVNSDAIMDDICGDPNPAVAKKHNSDSIRALYGLDQTRNVVHLVSSEPAKQFLSGLQVAFEHNSDSTCLVIKPHVFKSQQVGAVLGELQASGLVIHAAQIFHLNISQAC